MSSTDLGASRGPLGTPLVRLTSFDALALDDPPSTASTVAGRIASAGIVLVLAPLLMVVAVIARLFAAASVGRGAG